MLSKVKLVSNQRRIGLTGGIASGKTTIANYISFTKNIDLLDADHFAKELIISGTSSYKKIITHFGNSIIDKQSPSKEINRKEMKQIIFKYPDERIWMENLLHPLIKEKMIKRCQYFQDAKILILVIPLLFEAKFNDLCTEIWIVKCSKEVRIKRIMERDQISRKEALNIINIQMDLSKKEYKKYTLLDNEKEKSSWQKQIDKLI